MSSPGQYGFIILGNSGVGKSFLANILTGADTFLHQFQATSVTQTTTSVDVTLGLNTFTIFDIPGLIEADQARIDLNKQEIDKAFTQRPNSIILFVFGQINGRLRGQDIVAFNAINAAYPFQPESLILVVNGIPKNRPSDYEQEALADLQKLLKGVNVNSGSLCFTDYINGNNVKEKQTLKDRLVPVITKFAPQIHQKKQDIQTVMSQLKDSERAIQEQQAEIEAYREKHRQQMAEQKRIADQQIADQKKKAEELRLVEQRIQAEIAEQQRRARIAEEQRQKELADEQQRLATIAKQQREQAIVAERQRQAIAEANRIAQVAAIQAAAAEAHRRAAEAEAERRHQEWLADKRRRRHFWKDLW